MSDSPTRLYEGLFMVSQAAAGSDFAGVVAHIKEVLARAEATVHILTKWDERRLAYDIKAAKRGTYFLAVFDARSTQVANIERDCNLSEIIVRALILRGDHIGDVELEELKNLTPAEQETGLRSAADDDDNNEEVEDTIDDVDTEDEDL
jgi:ribosomal protein S6